MPRLRPVIALSCLIAAVLTIGLFTLPRGSRAESVDVPAPHRTETKPADQPATARIGAAYGQLPLSFVANEGQADARVKFISRGKGYSLSLTPTEAVLVLADSRKDDSRDHADSAQSQVLVMKMRGAKPEPRLTGLDQLPGKVNYLLGNDSAKWRTNVPTYSKVKYADVYQGVDLVYYGNGRQLEYDFIVAPGADPGAIEMEFQGTRGPALDAHGNLVLKAAGGEMILKKPVVYQEINGRRAEVAGRYALKGKGRVGFRLGQYDKSLPLIIDPVLVYSTYLGGNLPDQGLGIAVDSSGHAYVTGQTLSANFPVVGALQPNLKGVSDAFVTKLDPTGSTIVYSTYLGGDGSDMAHAIAVNAAGHAFVAGETFSDNFPTANALYPSRAGGFDAFVAELNDTGSALVYSTYLGGGSADIANAIAVDGNGNTYVAGDTSSKLFPTANALQTSKSGSSVFKTTDAAGNWNPSDNGLAAASVSDLALAANNPSLIYAATDTGVFKTTDGGANWAAAGAETLSTPVTRLAVNPVNAAIVYATTPGGVYKSTNGGTSWAPSGLDGLQTRSIVIDPTTPAILYAAVIPGSVVYKSTNSGASWNPLPSVGNFVTINALVIDPTAPATIYAGTNRGIYKSTNGGGSWGQLSVVSSFVQPPINTVVIDPNNSQTLYAAATSGVFKSTNGGANWSKLNITPPVQMSFLAIDATNPLIVYAATRGGGIFKTTNGGTDWTFLTNSPTSSINALLIDPTNGSNIFVGGFGGSDAFAAKLAPGGALLVYSTYLGGNGTDIAFGIAADSAGNAVVVGDTASNNFPLANALQPAKGDTFGADDAFITKINATGSALVYSTYLGGDSADEARAVALDSSGDVYVAGTTTSSNFPLKDAFQGTHGNVFGHDAFVTKINAAGSALTYSTYLGGDSEDRAYGIAVNSSGNAYVVGATLSSNFPVAHPVRSPFISFQDAFVTQLNPAGSGLVYSTFLGGVEIDEAHAVALDSAGGVYVTGMTTSHDFPTANPLQPNQAGDGDAFVSKILPAVDLAVTMTDSPDPVQLGSNLTYKIVVNSVGDLPSTGVTLQDTLPAGATFVSVATTQGSCGGTGPVNCNLGSMAVGSSVTVTLVVKPPAVQTITNTATIASAETEASLANNTASQETSVTFTDLALSGATAYNKVAPGARINYLFTVTNRSENPATNVKLTDILPAELTIVSCSAQGGTCAGARNGRVVTFPSLAPGQSATVLLVATVKGGVAEGTTLTNTATVTAATSDPNTANNSASVVVTVTDTPLRKKINGTKIAFSSGRIYTVRPNGSEPPVPFPNIPEDVIALFPTWSPDGKMLAFVVSEFDPNAGQWHSWLKAAKADGTGQLTLADNPMDFFNRSKFSWSPDGTRIVYLGIDRLIYVANADGTGYARLPKMPSDVRDIDWSPDGSKLLYSKNGAIFVVNLDGSELTKLIGPVPGSDGPTFNVQPTWSPDMTQILFTQRSNNSDVFIMNSDGTAARRLLNTRLTDAPAWSPDGTKLAFYQFDSINTVNVNGLGKVKVTDTGACCDQGTLSWQPVPTNVPLVPPTTPPAETFSIAGKLTNSNGSPFLGRTTITLTGTRTGSLNLEPDGSYVFTNLPAGGNYTVKPAGGEFSFTPASRVFNNLTANQTGADFVGTYIPINITGHVRDTNGNPIAGVKVTSSGGFPVGSTLTDANGFYSFPNVQRHRNYHLSIQFYGAYTYEPQFVNLPDLNSSVVVDFVGTKQPSNTIGGRVTSKESPNTGLSNVRVTLVMDGGEIASVFTDANGYYSFGEHRSGHDYWVSVDDGNGFVYSPRIIYIYDLRTDQEANFLRQSFSQYANISGKVTDTQGRPLSRVVMSLSGSVNAITETADDGTYSFFNIPAGLSYVLKPSKSTYYFIPQKLTINNLSTSGLVANFKWTRTALQFSAQTYSVKENAGGALITVFRAGITTGTTTVNYAATNGTATAGSDYTAVTGTLTFGPGVTSQSFNVPINEDSLDEANETIKFTLSGVTGGAAIINVNPATLTIIDNDPVVASSDQPEAQSPANLIADFAGLNVHGWR